MKKYILVEWPISQGLMEMSWFNECVLHPEISASYFVPEELFRKFIKEQADAYNEPSPYDNMPVVIREEPIEEYPSFIYNKDSLDSLEAYEEFVQWLAVTIQENVAETYEEIETKIRKFIYPVGITKSTLYDEWHKCFIKFGDVIIADVHNDILSVNGIEYKTAL